MVWADGVWAGPAGYVSATFYRVKASLVESIDSVRKRDKRAI